MLQRPGWDRSLVDFLESQHVPATFFASGPLDRDATTPRCGELLAVPFFELGTHGQRHRHLPALDVPGQRVEIMGPVDLLASQYRYRPTLFRAPYGEFDDHTRAIVADAGLRLVQWSVVSGDPDPQLTAATMLRVAARRHQGRQHRHLPRQREGRAHARGRRDAASATCCRSAG